MRALLIFASILLLAPTAQATSFKASLPQVVQKARVLHKILKHDKARQQLMTLRWRDDVGKASFFSAVGTFNLVSGSLLLAKNADRIQVTMDNAPALAVLLAIGLSSAVVTVAGVKALRQHGDQLIRFAVNEKLGLELDSGERSALATMYQGANARRNKR